jgi:hypothetical protein
MNNKHNKAKLTIAYASCGLWLAAASTSSASTSDYAYQFTANPGQSTVFNGTTVEIEVVVEPCDSMESVFNWNFIDTALPAGVTPSSQITPGTSYLVDNCIAGANYLNWIGEFDGASTSLNYFCENDGIAGSALVGDYVEDFPQIPTQYAYGSWAPASITGLLSNSVPDSGSSLELLAAATVALAAGRHFFRGYGN